MTGPTLWMLMAHYDSGPLLPAKQVAKDFFDDMNYYNFMNRVNSGVIPLPVVRMTEGQRAVKAFHLTDLATYID